MTMVYITFIFQVFFFVFYLTDLPKLSSFESTYFLFRDMNYLSIESYIRFLSLLIDVPYSEGILPTSKSGHCIKENLKIDCDDRKI